MENTGSNTNWVYENTQVQKGETCPVCASCAAEVPPGGPLSKTCPCATAGETNISRTARSEEASEQISRDTTVQPESQARFQEKAQDGGYCPLANGQGVNAATTPDNALSNYLHTLIGQPITVQLNGMDGPVNKNGTLQMVESGFLVLDEGDGQSFLASLSQVQTINTQI